MRFSLWAQLKTLLWRNYLLKRRSRGELWPEVCYPIVCVVILVIVKYLVRLVPLVPESDENQPTGPLSEFLINTSRPILVVASKHMNVSWVMQKISRRLNNVTYELCTSQKSAEEEYLRNREISAGIIFDFDPGSRTPGTIYYALRMPRHLSARTNILFGQDHPICHNRKKQTAKNSKKCEAARYLNTGFAFLQTVIDETLIENVTRANLPRFHVNVQLTSLNGYYPSLDIVATLYLTFAYTFFMNCLTVNLVSEKEKQTKQSMLMMGLRSSAFWMSWAIVYFLIIVVVTTVVTLVALVGKLFENSNYFLLFIMLMLYGMSVTSLAFLLTTFFSKAEVAGAVASFPSLLVASLYLDIAHSSAVAGTKFGKSTSLLWARCLFSPLAMAMAVEQGIYLDSNGGMNFDTIANDEFPLLAPLLMLLVDAVLYLMLAIYLEHVIPGEYGPRYMPWFCLMPSYWFSTKARKHSTVSDTARKSHIESVSAEINKNHVIKISNLTKTYTGTLRSPWQYIMHLMMRYVENITVTAVKKISLDLYEGQITALLGHNGAGKSTMINMLAGLTPPTSGSATLYGLDISSRGDMEKIRAMCGICPQQNILYSQLSAKEHLEIFAGIKGIPGDMISKEVSKALKNMGLTEQANVMGSRLTGGQERRLAIAIAIIGDPKIIMLDEPTSSLDPQSRRYLWALLKSYKEGRVILMSTHHMSEADIVADRKVIMNKGKIQCAGSSLFLKTRFGMGYHLDMVVGRNHCQDTITEFVQAYIPSVQFPRSHGKELAYTLPLNEVGNYVRLFKALEAKDEWGNTIAQALGIHHYRVSMPTLEEVFLKLGTVRYLPGVEDEVEVFDANQIINPGKDCPSSLSVGVSDATLDSDNIIENDSFMKMPKGAKEDKESVDAENTGDVKRSDDNSTASSTQIRASGTSVDGYIHHDAHRGPTKTPLPVVQIVDSNWSQCFCALLKLRFLLLMRSVASWVILIYLPLGLVIGALLSSETLKVTNDIEISANYYVRKQLAVPSVRAFCVLDYVNDSISRRFITILNSSYTVMQLCRTSPQCLMGMKILSTDNNTGMLQNYTIMYDTMAIHSLPAAISAISTALLQMAGLSQRIVTYYLPWPTDGVTEAEDGLALTLMVGLAFTLTAPAFGIYLVYDEQWKCRRQLRISGLPFEIYWGSTLFFGLIVSLLPTIVTITLVLTIDVSTLTGPGALASFFLLLLGSSQAYLVIVLVCGLYFDQFQTALAVLTNIFSMMGMAPFLVVYVLDTFESESHAIITHSIAACLDPPYTIFGGVYYIGKMKRVASMENKNVTAGEYFHWDNNILICLLATFVHFLFGYALLWRQDCCKKGGSTQAMMMAALEPPRSLETSELDDTGVFKESDMVETLEDEERKNNETVLYVQKLTKVYLKQRSSMCRFLEKDEEAYRDKIAVMNLSLTVRKGEVLGLLGPNGAGKTTTVNMIAGLVRPTCGRVVVSGEERDPDTPGTHRDIGFCPQYDPLWGPLKLGEHLELYAAIRGIIDPEIPEVVNYFIESLKLQAYRKVQVQKLSGGTRRKLIYALAMLGAPKLVVLDEPSAAMDPRSLRFFWDTVSSSLEGSDRCAVLVTQHMKEADALCSRVGILVNGQLRCIGSTQQLKEKYGGGYVLNLKLGAIDGQNETQLEQRVQDLGGYLCRRFPHARCLERYGDCVQYTIPTKDVGMLSSAFEVLEQAKRTHKVEEYSFSRATLEQVFMHFARKQELEAPDESLLEDVALWGFSGQRIKSKTFRGSVIRNVDAASRSRSTNFAEPWRSGNLWSPKSGSKHHLSPHRPPK